MFNFILFFYSILTELDEGIKSKNYVKLKRILEQTRQQPYKIKLRAFRKEAKSLSSKLKSVELIQRKILNLDKKLIGELKSYKNPPAVVHQGIKATLILLLVPEQEIKTWQSCKLYLTAIGQKSILRKIQKFRLFDIREKIISKAAKLIKTINDREIFVGSRCAAAFFFWTRTNLITYKRVIQDYPTKALKHHKMSR